MRKSGNKKNRRYYYEIDEFEDIDDIEDIEEEEIDEEEPEEEEEIAEEFVSGETLEFLSLDDEIIEAYNREVQKKKSSLFRKNKKEVYEEDDLEDEDWEEEEDWEEDDTDDEIDEEDIDDDDDIDDEDIDDEEDEEEYEYYEERHRGNVFSRLGDHIVNMSMMDRVVTLFGIFIVMAAVATGSLYMNARMSSKNIEAFAEVGSDIKEIGIIGESGLIAVSDAESARMLQVDDIQQEELGIEEEVDDGIIDVAMKLTSIQADIKIKFVNKDTNKLIGGLPFEVEVSGDNGKEFNLKDEDKDGIIYQTGVEAGTYTIKVVPLEGEEYKDYFLPLQADTVKVTETITYKEVDVADEVKTEAEVNVAVEDTAKQDTVVESSLTNTVEWVESTKSGQDSDANYQEIPKSDILDPSTTGKASGFMKLVEDSGTGDGSTDTGNSGTGDANTDSGDGSQSGSTGDGSGSQDGNSGTGDSSGSQDGNSSTGDGSGSQGGNSGTGGSSGSQDGNSGMTTPAEPTNQEKLAALSPSLNSSSIGLKKGGTATLSVGVKTSAYSYSVEWNSNNTSVATVNNGTITAQGTGSAVISAIVKVGDASTTLNCSVSVADNAPTYTIKNISGSGSVQVGKNGSVKAETNPAGGAITWTSSNPNVVKVDNNGTLTGVSVGSATITATCGTSSGTWNVTVIDAATGVTISGSGTIQVGKTGTVIGKTTPEGGKITWSSDNEKIVKVDSNGTMTGVSVGTANIIGTCGNAKGTWKVTVIEKYTALTISGSGSIKVGKTGTVVGKTTPAGGTITWTSDNEKIVKVDSNGTMTGVAAGTATITGTCGDAKGTWKVTVLSDASNDTKSKLKDKNGRQIYIKDASGKYIEATYADYYKDIKFYLQKTDAVFAYTGWQTIDGYTYFFDKNGNKVTGEQVIQGAKYSFGSDGRLSAGSGTLGIDVSKWNGSIDWNAVKNSGVSYVIIRCGYRGSSTGALIEDPKFKSNIQGAKAAGLKVGVYFFSQAVNEVEAVEEASMTLNLIKGYGLDYPVFLDVEASGGRGDAVDVSTRTAVCKAFCATIQNSGYSAGIYANKTWFTSYMNTSSLTGYKLWLAQYASAPTYTATRYDMWQYSSKGSVSGISGNVDMNISYMSY